MDEIVLWCYNCKRDVVVTAVANILYADGHTIYVEADYVCDECGVVIPTVDTEVRVGWPDW